MIKSGGCFRCLSLVLIVSIALVYACAKPPNQEIENAEKALSEAKQEEADLYVQDMFMKAEESLKRAKDLSAAKKYNEAKTVAVEATRIAKQALSMIEINRAKMKAETEQILQNVQTSLDEIKMLAAKAFKKKVPINREDIQGIIGKWEIDIINIKEHLDEQRIRQGYDQLLLIQKQIKYQKDNLTALLGQKET